MNRAQRRAAARELLQVSWLVAERVCEDCGALECPRCGRECRECSCCGEFSCERCGVYVTPPVPRAD